MGIFSGYNPRDAGQAPGGTNAQSGVLLPQLPEIEGKSLEEVCIELLNYIRKLHEFLRRLQNATISATQSGGEVNIVTDVRYNAATDMLEKKISVANIVRLLSESDWVAWSGDQPVTLPHVMDSSGSGFYEDVVVFEAGGFTATVQFEAHNTGEGADGGNDPYWTVVGGSAAKIAAAIVVPYANAPSGSKWISKNAGRAPTYTGTEYESTVTLGAGVNLATFQLPIEISADNFISGIYVNGSGSGISAPEPPGFVSIVNRTLLGSHGFVHGANTIKVVVADSGGAEAWVLKWGTPTW